MIYIYFLVSFAFTLKVGGGISDVKYLWGKAIAVIFFALVCMAVLPLAMGKLLYKIYTKHG